MIRKAATLDCDSVILDLEDAVPAEQKDLARSLIRQLAAELEWGPREVCVRINQLDSPDGVNDVTELRGIERLDAIVVPKAEDGLTRVHAETGKMTIPLIETARGLVNVEKLLSSEGVSAVSYGAADFALSVGGSLSEYIDNAYVKSRIAIAARANQIEPIDNVFFELNNQEGFKAQAVRARALGYVGKQIIHPSQIPIANEVFMPSQEDLEWARKVVEGYEEAEAGGKGAVRIEGRLIDRVHYKAAKRTLQSMPKPSK